MLAPISASGRGTDPIYRYLTLVERRKTEYEAARLLYVATTRARRCLHLLSAVEIKNDGSIAEPKARSFLSLLWPLMSQQFSQVSSSSREELPQQQRMIRRTPKDWIMPAPPPSVHWSRRGFEKFETPPVTFEWVGNRLRHAGTALHALLQQVAREGLEKWDERTVRSHRSLYRAMLANLGVAPSDIEDAAQRVEDGLFATLRDPRGRWILQARSEPASELSIAGVVDGKLCEAVIDRVFIDEAGVFWIIDYKTSEHQGGDLEAFFDNEKTRYQEQLERYARLIAQKYDRPIRLGLYFPLLGGWREWGAPVVLRKQAALFDF
jgi:ATP-dependent exoDNAse (exonuclease V) beta subunit